VEFNLPQTPLFTEFRSLNPHSLLTPKLPDALQIRGETCVMAVCTGLGEPNRWQVLKWLGGQSVNAPDRVSMTNATSPNHLAARVTSFFIGELQQSLSRAVQSTYRSIQPWFFLH